MSIKKKLATAVATAGLLAGLFGSAFVPAARAAAETLGTDSGLTCYSSDLDVESAGSIDGTCYAAVGSTVSVTVTLKDTSDASGGLTVAAGSVIGGLSITASGGVFADSQVSGSAAIPSGYSLNATKRVMAINSITVATANTAGDFRVNAVAPAAGKTLVLELFQDTTSLGDLYIVGTAAGTAGTLSGVYTVLYPLATDSDQDFDIGGSSDAVDNPALEACGGELFSVSLVPCYASGATTVVYQLDMKDGLNGDVETLAVAASVSGPCGVGIDDEDTGATASDEVKSAKTATSDDDGQVEIAIENDGDEGKCTLTITAGTYTWSRSVIFVGGIDSITVSGPSYVSSDVGQVAGFNDAIAVTCKDAAGTLLGDGGGDPDVYTDGDMNDCDGTGLEFTVTDADGVAISGYDEAADEAGGVAAATTVAALTFVDKHVYQDVNASGTFTDTADTFSVADDGNWTIPDDMCAADEEGDVRNLKVADASGLISATIKMTCVSSDVKIISMTALATGTSGSATSGKNGQTIKVSVQAEDGTGSPAGAGSTFTFTVDKSDAGATASGAVSFAGGAGTGTLTITLGTRSGLQYVIYSAVDANQATTAKEAFAQKISFTVTNDADALTALSISTGPKGRVVTASGFNAGELVKFEVENALTGVVRTYNRKANASGVATWRNATAALKYVTAIDSDDNLTDTISVKRK